MLGIITVVYNQKEFLKDLYDYLCLQSFKDFTLYVVDNNSTDGSIDYMKKLNGEGSLKIKYVLLKDNTGYAGGNNTGANEAFKDGCNYLFILNPDVYLEPNCINELSGIFEKNKNTLAAAPLILRDKNTMPEIIQEFGGKVNYKRGTVEKYFTGKNINEAKLPEIVETDFISGAACFIKTDVFMKAGMFEEKYFAYFDEIDLLSRINKIFKGKMFASSKAKLWHNHKWEKNKRESYYFEYYLTERNKFLYFRKFKLYLSMIISLCSDLIKFPWRMFWFIKVCNFSLCIYYIRGMAAGLFNKSGKPHFRFLDK